MERRHLLGTLATLGAGAIAGCSSAPNPGNDGNDATGGGDDESGDDGDGGDDGSGGDGSGDGGGGDGEGSGDDGGEETTADGGDADLYIAQAVSTLNAVALRLNKLQDELDSPDDVDFDEETLLDGIEESRSQLDAASETANETQAAQIETLRNLATVLEEMTRVVVVVLSVDPNAVAEDTRSAIDAGNYDAALSQVTDAKEKASNAKTRTETATGALKGVNSDRLAAVDGVEYEKVEGAVTETASLVDAFHTLTVGYEATLMGAKDLQTGRSESESKNFEAAEVAFEDGKAHFRTADETFSGVAADAPANIQEPIDVAACQTTHLLQAASAFQDAAAAAADGDRRDAKEARDEAEAQMQAVNECGT